MAVILELAHAFAREKRQNVLYAEQKMETLDQFEQNQRVIDDFVATTLARINGEFSRLMHVAMLRDLATGRYRHAGLEEIYSEPSVDQALHFCHRELFERILESPLQEQETELRRCLCGFDGQPAEIAARWREHEFYRFLAPSGITDYLRELFFSNLNLLLQLIAAESRAKPSA